MKADGFMIASSLVSGVAAACQPIVHPDFVL
jgi:hypothetical protein